MQSMRFNILISLVLVSTLAHAQTMPSYRRTLSGIFNPNSQVTTYYSFKVLNGQTAFDTAFQTMDGTRFKITQDTLHLPKYGTRDDGAITRIAHFNSGYLRVSPVSQLQLPWENITDKPNLFSGNYNDLTNKPTIPVVNTPTASNPVRSFNSAFQPSTTRNADVQYSITIAASMSLTGGQSGTVYLETSPNNSTWTLQSQITTANSGTLAVGLNLTNSETKNIRAFVPAGYWVRLRTAGGATITYVTSQEVLL